MTSPSHSSLGLSASAEQYSEGGGAHLDSPGSSVSLSPRDSLRTCPPIEHGSLKSHCDTGILQQLPSNTKSSTEAHASDQHAPKRASSRARASASGGSRTVSYAHGFHVGRRTPERPYKDHLRSSDPRVNDEGELAVSVTSANPRTTAFEGVQARPPFESAGLSSSSNSYDDTGAQVPNSPGVVEPSPSFSARNSSLSTGPLSAYLRISNSSSLSPTALAPCFPIEPSPSSSSFGSRYGSPDVPFPRAPYQILPTPDALVSQQNAPQPSVEADGYTIIRNAVSPDLVREVVTSIHKDLPVIATYETEKIYTTPVPAYKVRDEFVLKWRHVLRPFYEPMGKSIPKAPSRCVVGSFTESESRNFTQSFVHYGNENKLYVYIALTYVSPETGFYNIVRGSHLTEHPAPTLVNDQIKTPIFLGEGDAIVWRGDLRYSLSSKHGGHWQSLWFDWSPNVVEPAG